MLCEMFIEQGVFILILDTKNCGYDFPRSYGYKVAQLEIDP